MLLREPDKTGVLGHDDDMCGASGHEDGTIRRALEPEITNGLAVDGECRTHPRRQCRRKLIVEPEPHAATTG